MPGSFDPAAVRRFRFLACRFDRASCTARLEYGFDQTIRFREEVVFHGARPPAGAAAREAVDRALRLLHLAAGVSYYKAAAPPEIVVETAPLSASTARFFQRLYRRGLAEFAYRNGKPSVFDLCFPAGGEETAPADRLDLPRRTAVPVGGGKDSVVTLEALRAAGESMVLFSVGEFEPIRRTVEAADLPWIRVERRISPNLLELNRAGAYNGHVPVSAIIAFILVLAGPLYGFDAAALSNERSADAPDLVWQGRPVNHEYSKGLEFETAVDQLIQRQLPGFRYFSLLRPYSELTIAGLFARHRRYLPVFRSCNAAYRQAPEARASAWCGACPKCRFVFLALAPFLGRQELTVVFGRDLLADEAAVPEYRSLAGLAGARPLECVGDADESAAALLALRASPEWRDAPVVAALAPQLEARVGSPAKAIERVLTPAARHRVPDRLDGVLRQLAGLASTDRQRLLAGLGAKAAAPGDRGPR